MPTIYTPSRPPAQAPGPAPVRRDFRNVGGSDLGGRIVLGIILLLIGYAISGWGRDLLYALGAVSLLTAFAGYCPVNAALGRNTCRLGSSERSDTLGTDQRL